jgi:DNA-binding LacI/PurR family transcriptional regulator
MVTMNDIAAKAGVSQATVSYVLNERNNGIRIREETRQRILQTATEMGYRRNDLARAMVTGKNYVLGFLTRNPSAEGSARMLVGAQDEANRHGYFIKLLPIPKDADYRVCIERSFEQRLAGILAHNLGPKMLECLSDEAGRCKVPAVLMDDSAMQPGLPMVSSDDERGLQDALDHLQQLGHRHIGFVAAQANSALSAARAQIFRRLMYQAELPLNHDSVICTDWQEADVIESQVRELLATGRPRPTALLCAGDMIAMSTLRVARALGFKLPQELSVIGFADFLMASFADPPLTTVAQPFEEIGRIAVRCLLESEAQVGTPVSGGNAIAVPTSLVVRASTAPWRDAS